MPRSANLGKAITATLTSSWRSPAAVQAADTRTELDRVWRDFHTASQHALLVPG